MESRYVAKETVKKRHKGAKVDKETPKCDGEALHGNGEALKGRVTSDGNC